MKRLLATVSVLVLSFTHSANAHAADGLHRDLLTKNPSLAGLVPAAQLKRAARFIEENASQVRNRDYLTLIDFSKPSNLPRMHLVDLRSGAVESLITTHGSGSGDRMASRFSNRPDSRMTSLGLYLTLDEYDGKHPGKALRLKGLEASNSLAFERDIVIHAAVNDKGVDYASPSYIRKLGKAGRSWGCFAVTQKVINRVVDQLEGGSLILAFQ